MDHAGAASPSTARVINSPALGRYRQRRHHRRRQAVAAGASARGWWMFQQAARPDDQRTPIRKGGRRVFDNLPDGLPRLISIGRLDFNTEGLLLLTNDGGFGARAARNCPTLAGCGATASAAHGEVTAGAARRIEKKGGRKSTASNTARSMRPWSATRAANVWLVFAIRERQETAKSAT